MSFGARPGPCGALPSGELKLEWVEFLAARASYLVAVWGPVPCTTCVAASAVDSERASQSC